MNKNIGFTMSLNSGGFVTGLNNVGKSFRVAFNGMRNEAQKAGTQLKTLMNQAINPAQYNALLSKASKIVGSSTPADIHGRLQTLQGNMKTAQQNILNTITTYLKTNTNSILQQYAQDLKDGISKGIFVPRPNGLNTGTLGKKAYNQIVAGLIRPYVQQYGKDSDYYHLNSFWQLHQKLPNGQLQTPQFLNNAQSLNFLNSLKSGISFLDNEYEYLINYQANNKKYAKSYEQSNMAIQKWVQGYLDMVGLKGYTVGSSTQKELDESLVKAFVGGTITDPYLIQNIRDIVKLSDEKLVSRKNTLSDILKSVKFKDSDISNFLKKYEQNLNTNFKTADRNLINERYINRESIKSFKSNLLSELNTYKLNLSENYTEDEYKNALKEFGQRKDITPLETGRIFYLNSLYDYAKKIENKNAESINQSEELIEENTVSKKIENINDRFQNLNTSFTRLGRNSEFKRVTGKDFWSGAKNFLFGKDSKISNDFKESLTNLQNQQNAKLQELDNLAKNRYGLNLHGDYSKENFQNAFLQAFRNSLAEGKKFTSEEIKNIGQIGKSIIATGEQKQQINNIITADKQQREEEANDAQDINRVNTNLNALSSAMHRLGDMTTRGAMYGKGSVDEYVKYQSSVVGIAKLLPALRDQKTLIVNKKFEDFREGILELTNRLPSSGVELAHSAEVAARLGVTNPDRILDMVDLSAKLGATFGMAPDDVTQQVVKIANAMGYDFSDPDIKKKILDNVADPINYLDDHTAASGREILNFTKKSASIGRQVGMETKDVAAFGATLVSLGITSDSAATAFKNLITVMQTGARNQKKGKEYLEKAGFTQQELMEGIKKAPTATALKFLQQLNKLKTGKAGEDAASIARFGFGQMSLPGILALVNNPDRLKQYIEMANSGAKNWTEIEYRAKEVNDPAIRFKTIQNKYNELQITLGETLMPFADDLITVFKKFAKEAKPWIKENKELIKNTFKGFAYTALGSQTVATGADVAILLNNLRNFKPVNDAYKLMGSHFGTDFGTQIGKTFQRNGAILGTLSTVGSFLPLAAEGWAIYELLIKSGWLNFDLDKNPEAQRRIREDSKKENEREEQRKGNVKYRNNRKHSSGYQQQHLNKKLEEFQKTHKGWRVQKNKEGTYDLYRRYKLGGWIKQDNIQRGFLGWVNGFNDNLLNDFEHLKYEDAQIKGSEAREKILKKDIPKNVLKANEELYKYIRSDQVKTRNARIKKEEDLAYVNSLLKGLKNKKDKTEEDKNQIKQYEEEKRLIQNDLANVKAREKGLIEGVDTTDFRRSSAQWQWESYIAHKKKDELDALQSAIKNPNLSDKDREVLSKEYADKLAEYTTYYEPNLNKYGVYQKLPSEESGKKIEIQKKIDEDNQKIDWLNSQISLTLQQRKDLEQLKYNKYQNILLLRDIENLKRQENEIQNKEPNQKEDIEPGTTARINKNAKGINLSDLDNITAHPEEVKKIKESLKNLRTLQETDPIFSQKLGNIIYDNAKNNLNAQELAEIEAKIRNLHLNFIQLTEAQKNKGAEVIEKQEEVKGKQTEVSQVFNSSKTETENSLNGIKTAFDGLVAHIQDSLNSKTFVFKFKAEGLENIPQGGGSGDKPPEEYNPHK